MGSSSRLRRCLPTPLDALNRLFCTAVFALVVAVVYRYCFLDSKDPFKCGALLTQGHWLDLPRGPPKASNTNKRLQLWDPPGCLLHNYQARDISACLSGQKIVLVGDSTVRQVYWATAKKLDLEAAQVDYLLAEKNGSFKHSDLSFKRHGVDLQFVWDPYLNTTRLQHELAHYKNALAQTKTAIMLAGTGHWFARFVQSNPLKQFKDAVDNVASFMNTTSRLSPNGRILGRRNSPNLLLLAPIQGPLYDKLSPARAATITPEKIDFMNAYLQQLSGYQRVDVIWSWALMTFKIKAAYEEGGLHVVENVAARRADTLLNLRCNAAHSGAPKYGFPYDRTCCTNYGKPGWLQWIGLLLGLGVMPFLAWATSRGYLKNVALPSSTALGSFLVLFMTTALCFYTDRTQIFNKSAKHFDLPTFKLMCLVTFALGVLSIKRSVLPSNAKASTFLSRDQSDEWKGWMQFLILIYHYTGASKVLWIYQFIRLLVASYLFMTGFGHTVYFLRKQDFSLRRAASVLVRLNLLSCLLPYMMRTNYMFYYFAPLVSFWFGIVYFTMRVGRSRNGSLTFLVAKIILSAIFVQVIHRIPFILDIGFGILKFICRIHWDASEWRFRLLLDGTIVYVGMLAAILYVEWAPICNRFRINDIAFRLINTIASIASVIFIAGFWILTRRSPDKYDYNWWHPYISCLPIVSFLILRNSHRHLRSFYSSVFAWLGRYSLETFTLQFHIWMAADTKGLLSLGLFNRRRFSYDGRVPDFFILTPIFFWISWRVADATGVISSWIVDGGDAKSQRLPVTHTRKDSGQLQEMVKRTDGESVVQLEVDDKDVDGLSPNEWRDQGWRRTFMRMWKKDLRFRLGSLLVGLWLLNLTYF